MPHIPNPLDQWRPQLHYTGAQSRTVETWPTRLPSQPLTASETHTSSTRNPCTFNFRGFETWVSPGSPPRTVLSQKPSQVAMFALSHGQNSQGGFQSAISRTPQSPGAPHQTALPIRLLLSHWQTPALLLTHVNTLPSFSTLPGPHKKSPTDPQTITPKCGLLDFLHLFQQPHGHRCLDTRLTNSWTSTVALNSCLPLSDDYLPAASVFL